MIGYIVVIIGLIAWNAVISFFLYRTISHYNRLTAGVTSRSLKESLEKILDAYLRNKKEIGALTQGLAALEHRTKYHLQKVGIVRFNPFSDTGGSQSFTIAMLDRGDSGIVMTSLYARTGNRWYIKYIQNGIGKDVELSREEKAAIKEATDSAAQQTKE